MQPPVHTIFLILEHYVGGALHSGKSSRSLALSTSNWLEIETGDRVLLANLHQHYSFLYCDCSFYHHNPEWDWKIQRMETESKNNHKFA